RNRVETAICEYVAGSIAYDFKNPTSRADDARLTRSAIAHLDRAIAARGDYAEAYRARGSAFVSLDFLRPGGPHGSPSARADFERAVQLDRRDFAAWGSLADARFWLGDYEGALQAIDKAISIRP